MSSLKTHRVTLQVQDVSNITAELANRLFEAGCDDALLHSTAGTILLSFDREDADRDAAIASALACVRAAGHEATLVAPHEETELLDALRQLVANHRIRMEDANRRAEKGEPAGGVARVELDSLRSFHGVVRMLVGQEADLR